MKLTNFDRKVILNAIAEKRRLRGLIDELSFSSVADYIGVTEACVNNFVYRKKSRRFLNAADGR